MGGWFRNEIKSTDDFKGIKMRIPGIGAEIVNQLGGTAVNMPAGEIMPALQQGVIDAAEWVGPWVDKISGFHKITKYYYGPGVHEPGTANELIMDLSKWSDLSDSLKEIIINVCHSVYLESLSEYLYQNSLSLYELEEKYKSLADDYNKLSKRLDEFKNQEKIEQKKQIEFSEKIDELNQETDTLLNEIDKWQT